MVNKRRLFNKEKVLLFLLFCVFVILQMLQMSNRFEALSTYRGVFVSLQFGTCLLMIATSLKQGVKIATLLMSMSFLVMVMVVSRGAKEAVPGLCNAFFNIVTLIIIYRYNKKREIESRTDFITGVCNRRGLYADIKDKINEGKSFNVIYISVSNFKAINDSYGHAYGDELLRTVPRSIKAKFGKVCTVARVGGFEFVVTIDGKKDDQATADSLLEVIREKTVLTVDDNSVECYVECFAGVSNYPDDSTDYEALIKYADIAMSEANTDKAKQAYLFDAGMIDNIDRQVKLRNQIKEALLNDYFYLVYQPQYRTEGKKLRGFEALLRMKTADGEFVSPAEFIPVAEKSGLIFQIDDYVMSRVMREFKDIVADHPNLTVSVNVSAQNFADKNFVTKVNKALNNTAFPGKNLEIEITEYCMVNSMEQTTHNINELRKLDVQIALDDFGTGYTSLNYVASMPIDILKIDKSLIDDIENDKKRWDFVRAVITMGQLMECEIVSEGVENTSQIDCLKESGCDYIQGFVWGKPMMYSDAIELVQK